MTDEQRPVIRMSEPGEITQVVPHLLGFQPEESLVILVLDQGRIQVTARVDIDVAQPPGEAEQLLDRIWARFPKADALVIAYTNQPKAGLDLIIRCETHLAPLAETAAMLINGDTWHTPDGHSGPVEHDGPIADQLEGLGLPVRASRAELDALFATATITPDLLAQVEPALATLPARADTLALVARAALLIDQNLPDPTLPDRTLPLAEALQLAVLSDHPAVRDLALLSMTNTNADQHLQLWRGVVNNSPRIVAETPLYLAGMAAWITGDGATAVVALEHSQACSAPGRQNSALLDALIDDVVPPSAWPELREQILGHADPHTRQAIQAREPAPQHRWETVDRPSVRRPPNPTVRGRKPPAPGIAI